MDKTILIYASFGEGHKKAACSLQKFLNAPCIDLLDFSYPFIKKLYIFLYIRITQHFPVFWAFLFNTTKNDFSRFLVNRIQEFLFFPFFQYLRKTKPKVIIATHFFPFSFIKKLKEEFDIKLIAIVTDIRAHSLWGEKCVDIYFVAHEETKQDLTRLNIEPSKIISGYTSLREGFLEKMSEEDIRKKLSLDEKPAIVFVSSLRGNFPFICELIFKLKDKFNILVISGNNYKLKDKLEALKVSSLRVFTVYENIWEIFQLSSIIVTKPGGLTVFEGIYMKKPFICMHYIRGQEEDNMHFLEKYGIGKFVRNEDGFIDAVHYFLNKKENIKEHYPVSLLDIRAILKDIVENVLVSSV